MAGAMLDYLQTGSGSPSGAPSIPGVEWCFYQDTDTGAIYYWDLDALGWVTIAGASAEYPKRATLWHDDALILAGNALTRAHDTAQNYGIYTVQDPPANSNSFTHSFNLTGGSYTMDALGVAYSACGKIDWYIDNVLQGAGGQDWYAGSTTYNVIRTMSVTVVGDGYHVLKGIVNGKHASSSSYNIALTKVYLYPAAD